MLDLKNASPEKMRNVFENYFHPFWKIDPLTEEQVRILRSIIHPQIVIEDLTPRFLSTPEADATRIPLVLDKRQENNASGIGEGHRIIYGVAGSGKTMLLIARSKILQDRNPEARILLLCYNVSLSAFLKESLRNYPKIRVMHFDRWAKHNGIHYRAKESASGKLESDESLGKRLLENFHLKRGDYRYYDAILIDEAQDFPSIWFSCIVEALKDPQNGDLLIVCDGNQGIRPIGSVSWKSVGIRASGRTIHQPYDLDKNYRNTRGILKLAAHFTSDTNGNHEDTICALEVNPAHSQKKGPRPMLYKCDDHASECKKIMHIVKRLLGGKASLNGRPVTLLPHEIGILYRMLPNQETTLFHDFIAELGAICPVTWLSSKDTDLRSKVFDQSLKVQTIHSSKGLQYRVVIVMWGDMFQPRSPDEHDMEQRLLYVALTRATEILIMTYSKENEFIEKMVASGDIEGM
jgi:superfamily I DNA/RNA helicase